MKQIYKSAFYFLDRSLAYKNILFETLDRELNAAIRHFLLNQFNGNSHNSCYRRFFTIDRYTLFDHFERKNRMFNNNTKKPTHQIVLITQQQTVEQLFIGTKSECETFLFHKTKTGRDAYACHIVANSLRALKTFKNKHDLK